MSVMQSVLPHHQHLTPKELEVFSHSIVESIKLDVDVFEPVILKILSAKLNMTRYTLQMHRKNIRNKGWVKFNNLEAFTAKVVDSNPKEIEITIKIAQ